MSKEVSLEVFKNKTVLKIKGVKFEFLEGPQSPEAKKRYSYIKNSLENNFFIHFIEDSISNKEFTFDLKDDTKSSLDELIDSITSEVGRAVVALCIMQLVVKSICKEQSIRLHKGGATQNNFSWREGISMRVLDKNFITPTLRKFDLIKLNKDGFMMTRTLAENYPYSTVYKAQIRGKKDAWTNIVDKVETGELQPEHALDYCIKRLNNKTQKFNLLTNKCIELLALKKDFFVSKDNTLIFINKVIRNTSYSARLFEVAMHSLFQVLAENRCIEGELKPLSQMRSANKKHKNIGDIEVVSHTNDRLVYESWDAKYGKPYLRDELDELQDKLELQPSAIEVGFVVDSLPEMPSDIKDKCDEIESIFEVKVKILSFQEWVDYTFERFEKELSEEALSFSWIEFIILSLGQRNRAMAPIDEPCDDWIEGIVSELETL